VEPDTLPLEWEADQDLPVSVDPIFMV